MLSAAALCSLPLLGLPFGIADATTAQPAKPAAATVVYYDNEAGSAWSAAVGTAVANWNSALHNVQFAAGDSSDSTVTLEADSGWPETETDQPGSGTVYLGEEAVSEGYDRTRITAHELGHILGLPDNYDGDCSILMSGHSAGTSCTNAHPGPDEVSQVDQIFAGGGSVHTRATAVRVYWDRSSTG
ncbi:MAG TPA: snapalysin family zinc-dependent metalloprotease [Pseudonocardiaceae bacterium]|jgi:snapalysin|nr:snapalysin family zinc-dependent metalloprotease [Pseudonocardiaceae bacterium]